MKKGTFFRKGPQNVWKRGQRSTVEPNIGLEHALT